MAVDDFGTGYTSMAQLETMPVRTLKIDRSFVQSIGEDPGNSVIAKAIIDLAHEFGLQAVAEGVEDRSVTRKLQELDCDVAQGFLWSRPGPGRGPAGRRCAGSPTSSAATPAPPSACPPPPSAPPPAQCDVRGAPPGVPRRQRRTLRGGGERARLGWRA